VNKDQERTYFPKLHGSSTKTGINYNSEIYDFAIIGAGGAGMCLLLQFLKRPFFKDKRILVIEPDVKKTNDRTWCFWTLPEEKSFHELIDLADHRWDNYRITDGQVKKSEYAYHHLQSIDLYNEVHRLAEKHSHTNWFSEQVIETVDIDAGILIKTHTQQFIASQVFDSRFNQEQIDLLQCSDTVWQSFIGWRIKLKNTPQNQDAVSLMDFDVAQNGNTQFIYYLPYQNQEALVEVTRFGKNCIENIEAQDLLVAWIQKNCGDYQILEKEEGRIPMVQGLEKEAKTDGRIISIGTAAGAVKPTTGYAIKNMFLNSSQIADAIEKDQKIPSIDQGQRFSFYDSLLLHILRDTPEKGKQIFQQLFEQNPIDRIFKFLDEKTQFWEEVPLLLSLPVPLFLNALFKKKTSHPTFSRRNFRVEISISLLLILTVGLYQWELISGQSLTYLLLIGMIFPGIPHGAMDHCLSENGKLEGKTLIKFVFKYLLVMGIIVALWLWNASVGVVLFILYSAWHFGETDLREWGLFGRLKAVTFGLATLSIILFSHVEELWQMLYSLKAGNFADLVLPYQGILEMVAWILFLLPLFKIKRSRLHSYFLLAIILFMGRYLPLVPAFLWYFIAWHSFLGWLHIKRISGDSHLKLLNQSMPFTLGAFAVFLFLYLFFPDLTADPSKVIPYVFIFLAAISAPHILFMHLFYRNNSDTQKFNS